MTNKNKLIYRTVFLLVLSALNSTRFCYAKGVGSSAGLILFDPASARASSLAESFSAVRNDISAFPYNPASLRSLSSSQMSFMFQKGVTDDSRGRFLIGKPIDCGAVGLNLNYFDGGSMTVINGTTRNTVDSKTDLVLSLGAARSIQRVNIGIAAKYISSKIIEQETATALAADIGIQSVLTPRVTLGASLQNFGTKLKYVQKREELPRIARLGVGWQALTGKFPLLLLADAPYFFQEKEIRPSLGAEVPLGPIALRAGYRTKNELNRFSLGAGFVFRQFSLDYAVTLAQDIHDEQNISFNVKW